MLSLLTLSEVVAPGVLFVFSFWLLLHFAKLLRPRPLSRFLAFSVVCLVFFVSVLVQSVVLDIPEDKVNGPPTRIFLAVFFSEIAAGAAILVNYAFLRRGDRTPQS